MPWHVQKRGDKYAVVADESGKVMGEHDTEAKAEAQVRALYANEPRSARDHDREMRAAGETGMRKRKRGYNPPLNPTPDGPHKP